MSAAAVLTNALALIADQSRFTSKNIAADRHGNEVSYESDKAVRFSVVGAMLRTEASNDDFGIAAMHVRKEVGPIGVFDFEELRGHKGVVAMLKRAISAAGVA